MAWQVTLNDLLEVKVYCFSEGQYSINTLHYAVSGVVGVALFDSNLVIPLEASMSAEIKACLSAQAEYLGMSLQIVNPTRRPMVVANVGAGAGGVAGDVLPRQVAGLIRKRTSVASRHGRGRMYVPFPGEASNDTDGFPVAAYTAALNALGAIVDDPLAVTIGADTTTITPIILNRVALTGISITDCVAASTWATVRRRSDNRGADRPPF
jgi:hypothetical protein